MSGTLPHSDLAPAEPSATLQRSTQNYTAGKGSEIEIEVKNARRGEDSLSDFRARVERIEAESAERQAEMREEYVKEFESENSEVRTEMREEYFRYLQEIKTKSAGRRAEIRKQWIRRQCWTEIEAENTERRTKRLITYEKELEMENAQMRRNLLDLQMLFKEMEAENVEMRRAYLDQTEFLDPQKSLQDRLEQWKQEQKIFAVRHRNANLYPAFQFENGSPRPVINKILKAMPGDMSPWQTALWFESGNGWLSGDVPQECLGDIDRVVNAAARLAQPAFG